ncbi:MAG TPA: type II secretion system F family protein [Pirellulales bacterium]|jgi:type IV pilus assembly protein PilC|nr:type II secretion system F family protein [Pirellulales bacterium]
MSFADLFAPRPATKKLAECLRRLSLSLEAGIDVRRALESEARRSPYGLRERLERMSGMVNKGSSFAAAMQETGDYFPPLMREVVSLGEQTGHLPEVLKQLAEHYEGQVGLRRVFMATVAWPLAELAIALAVIGFLIWMSAVIGRMTGAKTDLLGLGLTGELGLFVYCVFLGLVGCGLFLLYRAMVTGQLWARPIQRLVMRIPAISSALRTLAVARFAWTMHIALDAALDVKRALQLAVESTHNAEFIDQAPQMEAVITRGHPIHEALTEAGVFPIELLHAVQVGEESGRLPETLAILAKQQLEASRSAFAILSQLAGWLVWCLVAGLIIVLIFRLAGVYFGSINQALKGLK